MADRPPLPGSLPSPLAPPAPALALFRAMPSGGSREELHELRVRIPTDLHRQLLSLKVLRGKSLAETVAAALDAYFQEKADAEARHAEPPAGG